jgi:hypothetical protein
MRALEDQEPQPLAAGDVEVTVTDQLEGFLDRLIRKLTDASPNRAAEQNATGGGDLVRPRMNED